MKFRLCYPEQHRMVVKAVLQQTIEWKLGVDSHMDFVAFMVATRSMMFGLTDPEMFNSRLTKYITQYNPFLFVQEDQIMTDEDWMFFILTHGKIAKI